MVVRCIRESTQDLLPTLGWALRAPTCHLQGSSTLVAVPRMLRPLVLALVVALPLAAQSVAPITSAEYAARRAALAREVGDGLVLVLGALEPVPDYLPWVQSAHFNYLTGFGEPGAALVMVIRGSDRRDLLFVPPKDPAREVWTGTRLGVEAVRETLGMDGRDAGTLDAVLDSLLATEMPAHVVGDFSGVAGTRSAHAQLVAALVSRHPARRIRDVSDAVSTLRGRKSPAELEHLRVAAEISARGHLAAFRLARPGIAEYELQAAAEHVWRSEGADGPGYLSILGSGENSTVLHYNANSRVTAAGDLVVMDMAASFRGYSADITRTIPVSGRFTDAQREIYEVVLAAQLAAERQVRAGGEARAMTDSSNAALRTGLTRLGLIESPMATYDCGTVQRPRHCPQLSLFYMHGLGHGIGLEVHDPDQYYFTGTIEVGSAFTIEPGIYVRAQLAQIIPDTPRNRAWIARLAPALARYAGIGVRIEDDYLVTKSGVLRPSAGVPRELAEVEAVMAEPRTPRAGAGARH